MHIVRAYTARNAVFFFYIRSKNVGVRKNIVEEKIRQFANK